MGLQFRPSTVAATRYDEGRQYRRLEFVEHHRNADSWNLDMHHGPWTIGLREIPIEEEVEQGDGANNNSKSRLEMFVNLADNSERWKHETCVGKITGGFDTLQRLLEGMAETFRDPGSIDDDDDNNEDDAFIVAPNYLSVRTITAMHASQTRK